MYGLQYLLSVIQYVLNNEVAVYTIGIATASWILITKWMAGRVCASPSRLDGKTVIITGGNTGIGKETALELSRRGARIIIGCRDTEKGERAAEEIRTTTSNVNVFCKKLDLASFQSIRAFSADILKSEPQIHILINNGGVAATPKEYKTKEGYEMQFGVNHLGHFLLTLLLLDRLKNSSPARIITVSSMLYKNGKINFEDINLQKNYHPVEAYYQSKLANVLFTFQLSKYLEGSGVTSYSLHPGAVHTELGRYVEVSRGKVMHWIWHCISKLFFKTPKQGAQTTIYCAVNEELATESGFYYSDCQRKETDPKGRDEITAKKLWELSERLTGIKLGSNLQVTDI